MTDVVVSEVVQRLVFSEGGPGNMTDHGALTGRTDDDHSIYALLAGRSGDRQIFNASSGAVAPWNMAAQSAAPTSPNTDDVYMDDGTNTANGKAGLRRYTGSAWEDLNSASVFAAATQKTISSGSITIGPGLFRIQPESGTSDDLTQISGLAAGQSAVIYVDDAGTDTITWKHGSDNISVLGGSDITHSTGAVAVVSDGTDVYAIGSGAGGGGGGGGSTNFPKAHIAGMSVTYNLVDNDHDIDISAGEARDYDDTEDMSLSSAITKRCDAAWSAGDNNGALLSGTLDADSRYGVWLIKNSSTGDVDVGIEKDLDSPEDSVTFPSGYDKARLIWVIFTDSSANIEVWQNFGEGGCIFEDPIIDVVDTSISDVSPETATMSVPAKCTGIFTVSIENSNDELLAVSILWPSINTGIGGNNRNESSVAASFFELTDGFMRLAAREMYPVDENSNLQYLAIEDAGASEVNIGTHGFVMNTRFDPYVKTDGNDAL